MSLVAATGDTVAHYELGAGITRPFDGTTEAFRATDHGGLEVMLEVLKPDATSVEKARFGTRARRLQGVRTPSLYALLDLGPTYAAFELPAGEPLEQHAGVAALRARQKVAWIARTAAALAAIHKVGIVHGHFELGNVLILPDQSVKVSVPLGGDVSGTPLEDVRALGIAAVELLLGHDPRNELESGIVERLLQAGINQDVSTVLARLRGGTSMTSTDIAERLAPFVDPSQGPMTDALIAVNPRR